MDEKTGTNDSGAQGLMIVLVHVNPSNAKSSYFNFHPLEVVSRYRDSQLQVGENYCYLLV